MKYCDIKSELLYSIDLFGKQPEFYYKGKSKMSSRLGLVFTIIYIILYIAFFLYKLIRMLKRVDVTFYDSYAYDGFPSINLTNENFYGGFSMGGIVDETLYYATATFYSGVKVAGVWNYTVTELGVEICKLEKFGSKYQDLFKNQPLGQLYCLKNVNLSLEGYANLDRFSYINVKVYPCVNFTRDGRKCQDYSKIYKFFASNTIEFKMEDNQLSPESYKDPVTPQEKDINSPVFLHIYQKVYSHIQIVFVETDEDLTGLNFWAKDKIEQYPKYESSMLIAAPGTDSILRTGGAVCDITMQLAAKVLTQRRKYTTLIEVLGDVGGLMELLWTFLNLICSFITDILYEKSLVNNLFSFDLVKKIIILKNKGEKNDIIPIRDINKKETSLKINNSLSELQQNNIEIHSKETFKNNLDLELNSKKNFNISHHVKKRKKKRISSTKKKPTQIIANNDIQNLEKVNNDNQKNILENNSNNFDINNFIKSDDIPIGNNTVKKFVNEPINIKTDIIKISQCCLCCVNKKKNMNKYLFEEGIKIFTEKLDILNLFDKLFIVEKLQTHFNYKENYIEMSEECKQYINRFQKLVC